MIAARLGRSCRSVSRGALLRNNIRTNRLSSPALNLIRKKGPGFLPYTTERVVELRSGKKGDKLPKTVYDAKYETENCGVGLVASLKSTPSRKVVEDADEMLVRMSHRGGCGCDPASGDGAGEYDSESLDLLY